MGQSTPGKQLRQPQQFARVDPALGADFAWIASVGNIVGPRTTPATGTGRIAVPGGIGINNGYAIVGGKVPSLYTTTWTECGVWVNDGSTQIFTISERNNGQAVNFTPGSNAIDLIIWGIADVVVTGPIPVGLVHYAIRRAGSVHTIWLNGKLYGSTTNSSTPNGYAASPSIGAQAGNAPAVPLTATNPILGLFRTPLALSDAQCIALSRNHWQAYQAPQRRLLVDVPAGGAAPTGTLVSTLDAALMSSSGIALNTGILASSLSNATMAASGSASASPIGTFASSLTGCSMAAAGAAVNSGGFASTLAGAGMSSAGIVIDRGAFASSMADASMASTGTVAPNATGTLVATMAGATMTAYGYNGIPPVLAGFFHRLPKNPRHVQRIP